MGSPSPEPPGPSILVVEVDKPLREDVSRTLKRAGYEVVLAGTGEEALDLIAAADFDGLYCEVQLPREIDGWEAAPPSVHLAPQADSLCLCLGVRTAGTAAERQFPAQALCFGSAREGVRGGCNCRASKAGTGMIASDAKISTGGRIKLTSSFVHLT